MKNFSIRKLVPFLAMGVLFVVSCKKNSDVLAPENNGGAAKVPSVSSTLITGRWGTSYNPASYDTVYVNLATGAQADTSTAIVYHMFMRSSNNSRLYPAPGYTMKWLYDPSKAYADLIIDDFTNTVGSGGLGVSTDNNNPNGWFYYPQQGQPAPVTGFYVMLVPNNGGTHYVFTATNIVAEGIATNNRGKYTISRGVINNIP